MGTHSRRIHRRLFASFVTVTLVAGTLLTAATVPASAATTDQAIADSASSVKSQAEVQRVYAEPLANPDYPSKCGLNVALQFDTSGSIDNTELAQMKTAAKSFVDALAGTPSKIALYHFDLDGHVVSGFTSVATTAGANTVKSAIDGIDGDNLTNWDAAFKILDPDTNAVSKADVVIIMTDGNPTTFGYPTHTGSPDSFDNLNEGIKSANGVKADGTRIVGVGIGNDLNVNNLKLISGPTADSDYFTTSFGDLGSTLGSIASKLCSSSVSVTKVINGEQQTGWTFNASGDPSVNVVDGVTNFRWTDPLGDTRDITEVPQDGYVLDHVTCTKGEQTLQTTPITNGVEVEVGPTDIIHCVFTNDPAPQIAIEKSGPSVVIVGQAAHFTLTVTNPGALPLSNVQITDPKCDNAPAFQGGDTNANGKLDPGETWTYTCSRVTSAGDEPSFKNTAYAQGTAQGVDANDSASWTTEVINPDIAVTKTGPAKAHVGDVANYTIHVSNPGSVPLFGIELSDPNCSTPTYVSGDLNTNSVLEVGEVWTFTCSHTILGTDTDPFVNTVTASGAIFGQILTLSHVHSAATISDGRVFATAHATTDIIHPSITLTKTASPTSGNPGATVTYTYVVTNNGDTPLSGVTLADDKLALGAAGSLGTLAAGASKTVTESTTLPSTAGALVNTATTQGTDELQKTVTATAKATVTVVLAVRLPRTGSNGTMPLARTGLALFLAGIVMVGLTMRGPRQELATAEVSASRTRRPRRTRARRWLVVRLIAPQRPPPRAGP